MNHRLLWKLLAILVTGVVILFYAIDKVTTNTQESMSYISQEHQEELKSLGRTAEKLYKNNDIAELNKWLVELQEKEQTWATVTTFNAEVIAGSSFDGNYNFEHTLGRGVDWKIHLYFKQNPTIELPFSEENASLLIRLPQRMRPGDHLNKVLLLLKFVLPAFILTILCFTLYRHIVSPLKRLEKATRRFSSGHFDVKIKSQLGNRNDEISELASTFDQMAETIGDMLLAQKMLIADLSHELRTPLTRLDLSLARLAKEDVNTEILGRAQKESKYINSLVEDTLALAWLDNESPDLRHEDLDLVDLIDVLVEDIRFQFPSRKLELYLPQSAPITNSNHRSVGQAIDNIIRNAIKYTKEKTPIEIHISEASSHYIIEIKDFGPGIPEAEISNIFLPFYKVNDSRSGSSKNFGIGLALAKRQIEAVHGKIEAKNRLNTGLNMVITLPK